MPPTAKTAGNALLTASVFQCPIVRQELSALILNGIKRVSVETGRSAAKNSAPTSENTTFRRAF